MSSERQTGTVKSVDQATGRVLVGNQDGTEMVFSIADFTVWGGPPPRPGQQIFFAVETGHARTARLDAEWRGGVAGGGKTYA